VTAALANFLPDSPFYATLSSLPPPDPTNPTATTTFFAQCAVHNSLPILEEITQIAEKEEEEGIKKEVEKRRTRLGASSPQQLRLEVGREYWSISQVHPSTESSVPF
jgi:superkiller protein 3